MYIRRVCTVGLMTALLVTLIPLSKALAGDRAHAGGFHSVKDGGTDFGGNKIEESWQGGNVAVRFTATYN